MTTILITEARSKYAKSYISLDMSHTSQHLLLGTRKALHITTGEMVKINVALPHKILSWSTPIVFTNEFLLKDVEHTYLDPNSSLWIYSFYYPLTYAQGVYVLPNTKINGKVVFE